MRLFNMFDNLLDKLLGIKKMPDNTRKCYICGEPSDISELKSVQSHVLVCGYEGNYHPFYYFHEECVKKALNLQDGYCSHSQVDKAIEITDTIKIWQDKKTVALEKVQAINWDEA